MNNRADVTKLVAGATSAIQIQLKQINKSKLNSLSERMLHQTRSTQRQ